ncbi:hypothetical protein [Arthrobacter sp. H14-L1]|uniref:hypothetical protein n=1 Tax=Arthrobacter sp. H14-L1 TaxID=2996697 RepID=UPI0022715D81|nr:hypothetical protein [Arthrobacter sp. H14-L1]MCY0904125.1 hypothetical protein [Arthrobacter sp. H14-L1]
MAKQLKSKGHGKPNPAVRIATEAAFDPHGRPKPAVEKMLLRAVDVQRPLVLANLRRLKRKHPQASTAKLSSLLERDFLRAVAGGGAAIGATAIVPGLGTVASLSISAAATVVFLETTALYAQSVAELHGVRLADPERARTTVMAIMLGEEGTSMVQGLTGHVLGTGQTPMKAWGLAVGKGLPTSAVKSVGGQIQKRFLKKFLIREGAAWAGRAVPFGIGAVIGGGGNLIMGRAVVAATRKAFGPAPLMIPAELLTELERSSGRADAAGGSITGGSISDGSLTDGASNDRTSTNGTAADGPITTDRTGRRLALPSMPQLPRFGRKDRGRGPEQ